MDHYIPGSRVTYSGYRYDNDRYYYDEPKYNEALALMKVQLSAIDPDAKPELLSSSINTYGLDASKIMLMIVGKSAANLLNTMDSTNDESVSGDNSMLDQVIAELIKSGDIDNRARFTENFTNYAFGWTNLRRNTYVGNDSTQTYGSLKNGSIEGALRDFMEIVYGCEPAQLTEFSDRLETLSDNMNVASLLQTLLSSFITGKWHDMNADEKNIHINKVISWLEKTNCFDALGVSPAIRNKLLYVDVRLLIDLFMTFLSQDYSNDTYHTDGFAQILTFMRNLESIKQNHSPNTGMAWVRAEDSLYANETSRVTASCVDAESEEYALRASEVTASASGEQILMNIDKPNAIISEYIADPAALLNTRTSVMAVYADGAAEELPVTWDTTNFESYHLNRGFTNNTSEISYTSESWVSYNHYGNEWLDKGSIRMFVFDGKVTLPDNVTNQYDISTDLRLEVFVDGLPKEETPSAWPEDGEYYGTLEVTLGCLEDDNPDIYYTIMTKDSEYEIMRYTGPFTLTLEEGAKESKYFLVVAWNQSNNSDYANSDIMSWYYVLNPVDPNNTVDENGYFRYTLAKSFTLSKDEAVCWRFDSSDEYDSLLYAITPWSADTIPTREAVITVCSLAGITPDGTYSLPVQISTDGGKTWTDDTTITFRTSDLVASTQNQGGTQRRNPGSSGGGCDSLAGLCGLGALLCAVIMKHKKH